MFCTHISQIRLSPLRSIHPDGDYHFFFARDFSWGILGHPWEETITI
ncbi:DUF2716 domain-containing protein [Paenibacillus rhizosphaerae]|nr:DUF2716 domain-containing protein [Paenibacillus rhizosphaerae]